MQMEVFRECQNSKALLPSLFTLLAVVVCPYLLSLVAGYCWIAQFFLHSFLDYRLTPVKKKLKKREAVFYIVSSPSGSGEILLHAGLFSLPQTLLWRPSALRFLHFLCPFLLSNSAQLLLTVFSSNFYILRNSSCRNKHNLHWKHHQLYLVIFTFWAVLF